MLFTQPRFLFLFLPLVLAGYYLCPRSWRNLLLLVASIIFYAAGEGYYTEVMLFSILFNYFMGIVIGACNGGRWHGASLAAGVSVNLLLLIRFKYADFLVGNFNHLLHFAGLPGMKMPDQHLPLGISFFTFHALSYVIDVWRGEVQPMRRFTSFALYITLFPQLIAGPIIRYKTIRLQFSERVSSWEGFAEGVRRFVVGLGKKMLIANTVATAADNIFALSPDALTPAAAWLGILCYAVQIYFDFSGYSDMAIGMGRMFGFVFPENFNYPYIAGSVTEFWRSWHITLSTWFRDYLYIPLGGNRVAAWRVYVNLLTVFFLCGLWHGASWAFVAWGLYHGAFLIVERVGLGERLQRGPKILRHVYLLLVVLGGWVFFRADTFGFAMVYFKRLALIGASNGAAAPLTLLADRTVKYALVAGAILSMPVVPWVKDQWRGLVEGMQKRTVLAGQIAEVLGIIAGGATTAGIFVVSITQSAANLYNPFIYYRF